MGGGKTHLLVGFGLLAKDATLRNKKIGEIPYQSSFSVVKIAAFNGRNNPPTYLWGRFGIRVKSSHIYPKTSTSQDYSFLNL